jgi:transaldolase
VAYRLFCESLCRFAGEDPRVRHFMIQTIDAGAQTQELAGACLAQLARNGHAPSLWIKLPPTLAHLRSIDMLRRLGCKTLVTGVFTPAQALLAMESGADGVAVYFGRLLKHSHDWERQLTCIAEIMREKKGLLLLASLANLDLLAQSLAYSRDMTLPPALIPKLMDSVLSQTAMDEFAQRLASE